MFRLSRLSLAAVCVALGLFPLLAAPASAATAATTVLMDSIGPGVMHGTDGFGSATVSVPKNGYVTYLVRTDSRLAGRKVQIWTNTGKAWKLTTVRPVAADGSVHYFARVSGRIGFWAKFADAKPAVTSHGRVADVSTDGTTTIRITCDDFAPPGTAVKSIVNRSAAVRVNGTVRLVVCSQPATGFKWGMVALDDAHLLRVGHTAHVASTGSKSGTGGSETWSVRLKADGIGRTTLIYSQPWRGGEKAAWTVLLAVQTS
jgi:predicted secreted protein